MARIFYTGFESGTGASRGYGEGLTGGGNAQTSVVTTTPHGGSLCLQCVTATSLTALMNFGLPFNFAVGTDYWFRFYVRKSANPANQIQLARISGTSGPSVRMHTDGTVGLFNQAGTQIGSFSSALSDNQWYRIEIYFNFSASANSGKTELRIDGSTVTGTNVTNANFATGPGSAIDIGWTTATISTATILFDDVALNDGAGTAQNTWPDEGKIIHLIPTSDSAVGTGWTRDNASATSLFGAVDNEPPAGVTDTTGGAGTFQIRNATSNANSAYNANMTTYTAEGVGSSDTIMCMQPVAITGAAASTSPKAGSMRILSNPVDPGLVSFGNFYHGTVVAGTYASGWAVRLGTIYDRSNANLAALTSANYGTAPVMSLNQVTSSTRIAMCCAMHIRVEYQVGVTGSNLTQNVDDTASVADSATAERGSQVLPADTATVADAQAFGFGEGVIDTAAVADAQTPVSGFNTTVPDTATVADSASGSLGKFANPADTATVADATTPAIGKETTVPDTAAVADSQAFGFGPGVIDTATVADAQTTASGVSITVPDTATVADAQTPSSGRSVTVPDSATVADSTTQATGKETVIPDTATVADAQTASAGFNVSPVDTATVADAQTASAGFAKTVPDTATVADSTSQQSGKETTVPDTLTVADAQAFGFGEGVADTATVADSQSFQSSGGTTITDSIGVADSLSTSAAFAISTTDPAAVADALRFDLSASLADALSVADSLTTAKGWAAQVADTLIVADAATAASGIQAALADNVSVADATAIARGISAALADTASVADAQTFQRAIDSAIADAIGVVDGTSFAQGRSIVIPDILVVADARALGISQHLDDAIDVDDAIALLGSGAGAAYIHHVPPLRGDIEPNDSNGLVVAIVADGVVSIYSASGLVLTLDDEGVNV